MTNSYLKPESFDKAHIHVLHRIQGNKERICVYYGEGMRSLAFVTPPATTFYPRLDGDGDYREGSQFGPQSKDKARFTIDINGTGDFQYTSAESDGDAVQQFMYNVIDAIDEAVLDFMFHNQLKFLGRKNLTKEEVKMLQIRSVKQNVNKDTGELGAPFVNMTARKFYYDQVGNLRERQITICDFNGDVIEGGVVKPEHVVSCTMHLANVYTGVGGDKFGIHWQLEEVAIICQAHNKRQKTRVDAFTHCSEFDYAVVAPYEHPKPVESNFQ